MCLILMACLSECLSRVCLTFSIAVYLTNSFTINSVLSLPRSACQTALVLMHLLRQWPVFINYVTPRLYFSWFTLENIQWIEINPCIPLVVAQPGGTWLLVCKLEVLLTYLHFSGYNRI